MKNLFKKIVVLCGAFILSTSPLFATTTAEAISNNTYKNSNDNNVLLFVPEDMTSEELEIIHANNLQEFPGKKIIIVKESSDVVWSDEAYTAISLNSDALTTSSLDAENQEIQVADVATIANVLEENHSHVEPLITICITHKWNETLVGSTYKKYSKDTGSWCYKMYQDVVRICQACDKTDELSRLVGTYQHDWEYGSNLGNYNYRCSDCGMRK